MKSPNRDRDIKRSGWYRTIPIRIATQNYELCLPTPNSRSEAAPSGAFPTPDSRPYLSHSTVYGIISVQLDLNSYIFIRSNCCGQISQLHAGGIAVHPPQFTISNIGRQQFRTPAFTTHNR